MQYCLGVINQSRAQYSLNPVILDVPNGPCAAQHASDVAACSAYSMANFGSCAHLDFKSGNTCNCASENQGVGMGDNDPAFLSVHQQMMAEGPPPPGQINHFWVITNPQYTTVAIAEYVDVNGQVWISEEWK
jgi:uncharacterized protein YbdZ (MbtH family)